MPFFSYAQTLVLGGAISVLAYGVYAWQKQKSETAHILIGLMAGMFAFWVTAPWIAGLGMEWRFYAIVWSVVYSVSLSFGPAICLHASSRIARHASHVGWAYAWSGVLALLFVVGMFLSKFGINHQLGSIMLASATALALLTYFGLLLHVVWTHYPQILGKTQTDESALAAVVLFALFVSAGLVQLAFGPVSTQWALSMISILFFAVAVSTSIRSGFLGIKLHPLEGYFLVMLGASAVLLFHSHDNVELVLTFVAVILMGAYGQTAIRMVMREHAHAEQMDAVNRRLQELEEARKDFTAMVAHQLRSPIGAIRAAAASMSDGTEGPLPPKAQETAELIQNSADRLLGLAETYLEGVRLQDGTFTTKSQETDVAAEITSVVRELSALAKLKGLPLVVEAQDVPKKLRLDRDVLRHSCFNVVDNAVKYTDHGSVTITATWRPDALSLSITDTGIGLSAEDLRGIFERYSRSASPDVRRRPGSGLGLYIVRKMLKVAGGRIQAKSEGLGKGATFVVELPAVRIG